MASVVKLSEEFGKAPARMEVQFDPQYFVGYLSLTDEATPMAPASPAGESHRRKGLLPFCSAIYNKSYRHPVHLVTYKFGAELTS